jgi:hypothetical protein
MPHWKAGLNGWKGSLRSETDFVQQLQTMNSIFKLTAAMLLLLGIHISSAQSYSIDWYTIDGGGGTSTGGVFSISGTVGQPDAGTTMTNGQYAITGGFWALPAAIQVAGAPTLVIVSAGPLQASISWSPATPGFILQETWTLTPANWTNSPSGATNPVIVPATLPAMHYRLFRP